MASKKAKTGNASLTPKFAPDYSQTAKRIYSNYASVRASGVDFTITFMDVCPPSKDDLKKVAAGTPIPVPVSCEVVLPNGMILGLIKALTAQYDKYTNAKAEKNK